MLKVGIIGGGPAGLLAALQLKNFGYEVIVTEAGNYDRPRVGEHLVAEAVHEFRKSGIPEKILHDNSAPCTQIMNSWGGTGLQDTPSIFNPFGDGFILKRPDFDRALMQYTREQGVLVRPGERVTKVQRGEEAWHLHLADEIVEVDFVVDASGRNSKFKPDNGIQKEVEDQLIGITNYLPAKEPGSHRGATLMVEPLGNGWWYSVQLMSGEWVGTFMTDAPILTQSGISASRFWEEALEQTVYTRKRFKGASSSGKPIIQSAHSRCLNYVYGERWLSTGDAAISFDPLSSSGIIKGFRLGLLAAQKINQWYRGSHEALVEYDAEVKKQYREYLQQRQEYYAREIRWPDHPFWYTRNLRPREIRNFSIHPGTELAIRKPLDKKLQQFLLKELPEIDFEMLLKTLGKQPKAGEAIENYLSLKALGRDIPPYLLHALESLLQLGVIEKVKRPVIG